MTEDGERRAIRVTIFGEDYQIRTDLGEEYTRACAEYVDEAIQEAHIGGHIAEPHKAAILAAMKITDELFRARDEREELSETVQSRLGALAQRVEAASDGESAGGSESGEAATNGGREESG